MNALLRAILARWAVPGLLIVRQTTAPMRMPRWPIVRAWVSAAPKVLIFQPKLQTLTISLNFLEVF